jgi:beta-glucosidase
VRERRLQLLSQSPLDLGADGLTEQRRGQAGIHLSGADLGLVPVPRHGRVQVQGADRAPLQLHRHTQAGPRVGAANPSGRLAETLPLRLEDTPSYLNFPGEAGHVRYGEGIFVGYRGYDTLDRQVSYPFGHGLAYTSFGYTDLTATITGRHQDGDLMVEVACHITNTGERRGKEVVQLYVGDREASVARPPRELRAFAKVDLDPGETTVVAFALTARDLSWWSTRLHDWALEAGEFQLAVGASSRDLRLTTTVDVAAPPPPVTLDAMATLQEWLADATGAALLHEAVGTDDQGRPKGILGNQELLPVIGNFPISTLAAFPGLGLTHELVHALIDQISAT